jgi:hypothetical protein
VSTSMMPSGSRAVGARMWVIADGWIPPRSSGPQPEMYSHEGVCILNAGEQPARIDLMVYFTDREPSGPYRVVVDPRRSMHLAMNDLVDPEPIPHDADYSVVVDSDVDIVVQHTRVDTRQAELAVSTTIAYPV